MNDMCSDCKRKCFIVNPETKEKEYYCAIYAGKELPEKCTKKRIRSN
jgi:hypothetical protein